MDPFADGLFVPDITVLTPEERATIPDLSRLTPEEIRHLGTRAWKLAFALLVERTLTRLRR